MAKHYDHPTLQAYARGGLDERPRRRIEAHLAECSGCREYVEDEQVLGAYLRDAGLWEVANVDGEAVPVNLSRVLTFGETLATEDREARELLEGALASPEAFQKANVGGRLVFETKAAVRHLCAASRMLTDSNPKFAQRIAADAARIAHRAGWPLLRADALVELGWALIRLDKLPKAEEILVAAEQALHASGENDVYGKAIVWYSRAAVARELRRFDQALEFSQKAAAVFQHVDSRMLSATMSMTANVLFAKRRFAEAAAMMDKLLASSRLDAERDLRAMALHNAGAMHLRAGHDDAAMKMLSEAAALFEQLGQDTWVAKSDWLLAALLTRFGTPHEAAEGLDRARSELRRLGLTQEAALAGLDLAEALLLIEEKHRAAEVCKEVVLVFTAAEMQREADRALAYIREAVGRGTATPSQVREVRLFLEDLPNRPATPPS